MIRPTPIIVPDIDRADPVCDACGDMLQVDSHQVGRDVICTPCRTEFFPPSFPDARNPHGDPMSVDAFIRRGAS